MADRTDRVILSVSEASPGGWLTGEIDGIRLVAEDVPLADLEVTTDVIIAFPGRPTEGLSWGSAAWNWLDEVVGQYPGDGLLLRGHHQQVMADGPACLRWLDHGPEGSGIALAPASMLAPSMLEARDEHLMRMFEYCGARSEVVILEDVADGEEIQGRPLGEGILPGPLVGRLIDAHVPRETPVLVRADDPEVARAWLWPES
ncbi:MAG: hypothetical protein MK116_07720 [Phycisphaerales bacterium]|nr:hypothetical protein [Phycisphaerales bacterium]